MFGRGRLHPLKNGISDNTPEIKCISDDFANDREIVRFQSITQSTCRSLPI